MKIKLTKLQPGDPVPATKCNQGSCLHAPLYVLHEPRLNKVTVKITVKQTGWCWFCAQKFLHLEEVAT